MGPHTSYLRLEANLPNECWQTDTTHWTLAIGTDIEILDIIVYHSQYIINSTATHRSKVSDVTIIFKKAFEDSPNPASILTDNGAIFTAQYHYGHNALKQNFATAASSTNTRSTTTTHVTQ